jgi:hypothetical protein
LLLPAAAAAACCCCCCLLLLLLLLLPAAATRCLGMVLWLAQTLPPATPATPAWLWEALLVSGAHHLQRWFVGTAVNTLLHRRVHVISAIRVCMCTNQSSLGVSVYEHTSWHMQQFVL